MRARSDLVLALLAASAVVSVFALQQGGPAVERVVDAAVSGLLRPALAMDRIGLVEHGPIAVQGVGLGAGVLLWLLARRFGPAVLWIAAAGPALGLLGLALGLAPGALCAGLVAAAVVGIRGDSEEERGGGTNVDAVVAVGLGLVGANGITLLTSGPGDSQTPLEIVAALDGLPWLVWLPALGLLVLAAPEPRRRWRAVGAGIGAGLLVAGVFGDPWDGRLHALRGALPVAVLGGGLAAVLTGPQRVIVLPVVAGLVALFQVAVSDFGGCEAVRQHPAVTALSDRAGAFAVQPVEGGVIASFRDRGLIERLGHDGSVTVVDPTHLDLPAWAAQREEGFDRRIAYPEELGLDPRGRVHAFVELPGDEPATALVLLDGASGEVLEARQGPGRCFVSSWVWTADGAVAGCEWSGRMLRFDPEADRWFDPLDVEGGELEEMLVEPDGSLLAAGLWSSPWLRRLDRSGAEIDRVRVGTFAWGLGRDPAGTVHVARFHGWHLRRLDSDLRRVGASRVGYGVRALAWAPKHRKVMAASGYDGHLYGVGTAQPTERLRLGGWLRDVDVEADGRHAVTAGVCGVLRVDLDAFFEAL